MKKILIIMSSILIGACTQGGEWDLYGQDNMKEYEEPAKSTSQQQAEIDVSNFDTQPVQNVEQKRELLTKDNMYMIDKTYKYEAWAENKTFTDEEQHALAEKWKDTNITTKFHYYHGNIIKIDHQKKARDLREMRLRFYYGENDGFNDGDINHVLSQVSKNVIKENCGRGSMDALIVYDRPSAEFKRPNAFYDYQMIESGVAVREVGYRCMYPSGSMNGNFDCDK